MILQILSQCFDPEYVAVVTGGRAENTCLLREHFDYIFFTGSQSVGKEVMRNAAEHLTPVTLELGGKSPCIVDKSADIKLAARRIVFGKYLNCGQTCVAPDYIYCHRSVKDKLIKEVQKQIQKQYGKQPLRNPNYGKIINEKHFDRLLGLIDKNKTVHGGGSDRHALRIEPTVLDNVTFADAVMQEEIFGPIMPILIFDNLDEAIRNINAMPHPLALYLFTSDKAAAKKVTSRCGFGGGCINDTIIHLATTEMGFGGFGESGMGSYRRESRFRHLLPLQKHCGQEDMDRSSDALSALPETARKNDTLLPQIASFVKRGQGKMQIGTPANAIGDVHLCKRCTSPINNIGLSLD